MRSLVRWAPASGIVFVIMVVVGAGLWNTPEFDAPASEWTAYFEDGDNRAKLIAAALLIALSAPMFLIFSWTLSSRLGGAEGGPMRLSTLVLVAGVAVAVSLAAWGNMVGAVSGGHEFGDAPLPSAELIMQIENIGIGFLLLGAGFAASLLVAAASLSAFTSEVLPRWLAWVGFVVAAFLLLSFLFLPFLLFPIWVVVVSIVLLTRAEPVGRREAPHAEAIP